MRRNASLSVPTKCVGADLWRNIYCPSALLIVCAYSISTVQFSPVSLWHIQCFEIWIGGPVDRWIGGLATTNSATQRRVEIFLAEAALISTNVASTNKSKAGVLIVVGVNGSHYNFPVHTLTHTHTYTRGYTLT